MKGNEEKPRIGLFGRRNVGKSSLINYLTGQQASIVSPEAGTTTDPVRKSMELVGVGPVVWVDTAGIDDEGELGAMRVQKSYEALPQCDLVLLVYRQWGEPEEELVRRCEEAGVKLLFVETGPATASHATLPMGRAQGPVLHVSVFDPADREPLTAAIRKALPETAYRHRSLLGDILQRGEAVVLVCPIDSSAPEGRMILPQVQVLRDVLDNHCTAHTCQPAELPALLASLREDPRLVITDSQAFAEVARMVPERVPLTSFSVVLARAKGMFEEYVKGTPTLDSLRDGDRLLILESCTHDVTCEDIGRVKLPALIRKHSGRRLEFDVVAGLSSLERPITDYRMAIQCGGCVVTAKQLSARLLPAVQAGVPVSNYGLALAYLNGIFHRSMQPFNK